jgi:multidrug efflux system membrane fusion protein
MMSRFTPQFSSSMRRLAASASVLVLAACGSKQQPRTPPATPVRVAATQRIDAPVTLAASGVVEPMQTVAVTTQVTGTLQDVLFREGEMVQAGQVLFHVDPRPLQASLDQARATLARDEAQAAAGRNDDLRYQALAAKGYVSRSQADQVHATALAQQATVEADRAALRATTVSLGFATIRAPITGRTGSLLVRRGNIVSPGSGPLVVINQLRPVLVRFPIADQDFPHVQQALATHPLSVVATSNDSTQASERGQLSFLDNAIDSLTGTVTGKATFPNSATRLWPGELVFLTIQVDVQRGVLAVPNEAVLTGQQGSYVYVIDGRNTAQSRNVVTGLAVGDLTVIAQGLADGDRVVIDGQSRLNPGSRVALVGNGADSSGRSLSSSGGAAGTAAGEVTGVATPGGGAPGGGARGGDGTGAGTITAGNASSGAVNTAGGRASGAVAPAPSMTGVTGTAVNGSSTSPNGSRSTTGNNTAVTGSVTTGAARTGTTATGASGTGTARSTTTTTTTTTRPPTTSAPSTGTGRP